MTDREKLIEILAKYFTIGDSYEYSLTRVKEAFAIGTMTMDDFVEFDDDKVADIADHLISHGVTVQETKKLLKRGFLLTNSPCWIEIRYGDGFFALEPAEITKGTGANYYIYRTGEETPTRLDGKDYGKWWRCWAEKPTEAERKNAKWEE